MKVIETDIPDVKIIEPTVFGDERGFFMETWNQKRFEELVTGKPTLFVQDNHSKSKKGVLRGLHYQSKRMQGKLVRVSSGAMLDVAVDIRRGSVTFGHWVSVELSAENKRQLWIPEGFAHGFLTLSDNVECLYKTTDYYHPEYENTILWNDKNLGINWGVSNPILSEKDKMGLLFSELFGME
ncbi:dTDP-4-dehydrorhamnose 3,5-epimerase [Vibrio cholerae]|uniref:dTDP-4-dehydrorhamnose 3,5-epimerase n=1 Tax=Vibrio cholerae TaxID=666 RepID=UPI0007638FEF|nr:dTDP-4-dehydrorhamnose 3,5-epimerase [Vibrio cholerae]EJB8349295.1 dTDP-4-dehydrorhamnose 3,5-epimerase [Vibrio cholerae]EJB8378427.1 dTDP-4-dehydrorhamnose 3,5-epimerase [Vibrio cholerae]KWW45459.1 dTDP-4-dehydrorhamnose 3,5-epimerase [Vibrio cholerae]TXY55466.1 dTDP-4-dehydrorhamnose 3,5-epimerase [Vibrio cholerae]BCN18977.1 dTDP-4-dehydrorhamnose 3,5-epimerase [Vibrio cholerae]